MSQAKKVSDFRVIDLLEQVQRVDKLIAMYRTLPIDRVAESMILQYSVRRQEFVDQHLMRLLKNFLCQLNCIQILKSVSVRLKSTQLLKIN